MIRSFGCSWSCEQPWTTAISDHAAPPVERPGWRDRVGPSGRVWSGSCRWARRSRPGPPGAAPRSGPRVGFRRCLGPVDLRGWLGWVHNRTLGLRGRPSPTGGDARSRRDRRGSGATQPAVVPTLHTQPFSRMFEARPPRGWAAGRSVISRIGASAAGVQLRSRSADHGPASRGGQWARTGPQPVKWHPNRGGLVVNGRAPASGTAARAAT
jgi:hypothetical protein